MLLRTIVRFLILPLLVISGISIPRASATPYCDDYFRSEWNTRLDMSSSENGILQNIPDLELGTLTTPVYSGGNVSFTTTDTSPRINFLQYSVIGSIPVGTRYGALHPIDTTKYRNFSIRMYSSNDATAQLMWFFTYDHYATTIFSVQKGWHTYTIDLASAATQAPSSGSPLNWTASTVTGLTLIPVNTAGTSISIDWVQLTTSTCGTYDVAYNSGTGYRKVVLDDNTNPSDGYQTASAPSTGGTHSLQYSTMFPGTYNLYGYHTGDWKIINYGTAFTMDDSNDIAAFAQTQLSNISFSGSRFSATTTGTDPSFYIGLPSGTTIDPTVFQNLSFGIEFSGLGAGKFGHIYVFTTTGIFQFDFMADNGYQIIHQSLVSVTGQIQNIRIDPSDDSGISFSLDFVSIASDGLAAGEPSITPDLLGMVTIQDLSLDIMQPDERGGTDFAQTVLGRTWNMTSASTFVRNENLSKGTFYPHGLLSDPAGGSWEGSYFKADNAPANGDPIEYLLFQGTGFDSTRFVNLCFRGWNKNETPVYNSVGRIIWFDPRYTPGSTEGARNGDDIVYARGNKEYCLDLRKQLFAQVEPAVGTNPWTDIGGAGQQIDYLRLDLNENSESSYYSVLDYVSLKTDHEVNSRFAIVVDASLSYQVDLSYNTSESTSGATAIASLAAGRNTNTYLWDTSGVPDGSYYIIATVTSGGNTVTRYSKGRVNVSHSRTQDTTAPVLSCERPYENFEFDTSVEIAGYALDETRIASVEVLTSTDNSTFTYLDKVQPSIFHAAALASYPNYADSNAPGFHEFLDTSALSYGPQYIKIIATDTSGNSTSCVTRATRSVSASIPPLTYPTPNNSDTLDAPLYQSPDVKPTIKATVSKAVINFTLTGCTTQASVYAQTSKALLTKKPLLLGKARYSATASALSALKKGQAKSLYLKAVCGSTSSSVVSLNVSKIKAKKQTTLALLLKLIKKKFKEQ